MKEVIKSNTLEVRMFFFLAGIIATLAYRVIIVLNVYATHLVNFAWYVGTIGFILYFWHRYKVQNKREELVENLHLIDAVKNSDIDGKQKLALDYIVRGIFTSKSRWNSLFIVILSTIALAVGIVIDFVL